MHHNNIIIILLLVVAFSLLYFFPKVSRKSKKKHIRNINKSKQVLFKMNQFEGVYKEAQMIAYLRKIDPYVFEELLLEALFKKGFEITRNKRYSGDGGIDGKAHFNGQLYYIQAKRYQKYIALKHLDDFQTKVGKDKGLFVHTGKTGKDTYDKFRHSNVEIISGKRLIGLLIN
jgi:restriction system protein